jgi:hypothetical protein
MIGYRSLNPSEVPSTWCKFTGRMRYSVSNIAVKSPAAPSALFTTANEAESRSDTACCFSYFASTFISFTQASGKTMEEHSKSGDIHTRSKHTPQPIGTFIHSFRVPLGHQIHTQTHTLDTEPSTPQENCSTAFASTN